MPVTNGDDTISFNPNLLISSGNPGNDTYLFGRSSGTMVVRENGAYDANYSYADVPSDPMDVVQFDADVLPADVVFTRSYEDLVISIQGSTGKLIFSDFFQGTIDPQTQAPSIIIEEFRFANGTVIRGDTLVTLVSANPSEYIHGTQGNDSMVAVGYGNRGVHTLFGKEGNDTLSGSNNTVDYLYGGSGDDVYQINPSIYGAADVIGQADGTASEAGFDALEIQGSPAGVRLARTETGFNVVSTDFDARVLVSVNFDGYENGNSSVEAIRFSSGEVLNLQDIKRILLTPTTGNDTLYGFVSNDVIEGGAGNDVLYDKKGGNDLFLGGTGNDTMYAGAGSDTLDGGEGTDYYYTEADDTVLLSRESGIDTLGSSACVIQLAPDITPSDILVVRNAFGLRLSIRVVGTTSELFLPKLSNPGVKLRFANGQEWDGNTITQQATFGPSDGGDSLFADPSYAVASNLSGGLGDDYLYAYSSDPNRLLPATMLGGQGDDTINGGKLADGGAGNDLIQDFGGTLLFGRGSGQDWLDNSNSNFATVVQWGAGVLPEDIEVLPSSLVNPNYPQRPVTLFRIRGTDDALAITWASHIYNKVSMNFANGQSWTAKDVFNKVLAYYSTEGDDLLDAAKHGTPTNTHAFYLEGKAGNDTLIGKGDTDAYSANNPPRPADTLDGGAGNDLLRGDYWHSVYLFGRGYGADTIESGAGLDTYNNRRASNRIQLAADIAREDVAFEVSGNDLIMRILGTNDSLLLKQFMPGSTASTRKDWRIEFGSGQVLSRDAIDALAVTPSTGVLLSTTLNTVVLTGGAGNDTLWGYSGNDTLIGGAGNDLLQGKFAHDVYLFNLGDGHDTIRGGVSNGGYQEGDYDAVRFGQGITSAGVVLVKSGDDLVLQYNNGTDSVTIENYLDRDVEFKSGRPFSQVQFDNGELWTDAAILERLAYMPMTVGDDYWVAVASKISASGLEGNDTLMGGAYWNSLYGNAGQDLLMGQAGNDTLDGGEGNDTLKGDADQDTYVFGRGYGQDRIIEDNLGTADTIRLAAGISAAQVQLSRTGRDLVLSIAGTTDALTVEDYFGSATVADVNTAKIESIQFADGVIWDKATITSKALANNAGDDVYLAGYGAVNFNGGAGNDVLTGNYKNDTLNGGAGNDRLNGEGGQDLFVFGLGDGQDTVMAPTGTGTATPDLLQLNVSPVEVVFRRDSSHLYIDLPGGRDTLTFDNYFKRPGALSQINFADGTVWNAATILAALPSGTAQADLLQGQLLYGNEGNDTLLGVEGVSNDTLHGGLGWDSMAGGAGNDAYTVDSTMLDSGAWANDLVVELLNGGTDTVTTNVSGYVLPTNVENMVMTGKGEAMFSKDGTMRAYGNELNNRITGRAGADLMFGMAGNDTLEGGAGNDTLNGGAGLDSLIGGDGDDYYVVDRFMERVSEWRDYVVEQDRAVNANAGVDWVETRINGYFLPDHVENLRLVAATSGAGNGLSNLIEGSEVNNLLRGFAGDDTLRGLGGNDTLEGGAGADQLEGGEGDDTYLWGAMHGADVVQETAGANDVIQLEAGVSAEQLWFQQSGNDLVMRIIGTADQVLIKDWYTSVDKQVERVLLADGRDLQSSQVQALVDAMAGLPPPAQSTLPADANHAAIAQLIAASWA